MVCKNFDLEQKLVFIKKGSCVGDVSTWVRATSATLDMEDLGHTQNTRIAHTKKSKIGLFHLKEELRPIFYTEYCHNYRARAFLEKL